MSRVEFDKFAKSYRSVHAQSLAITGEEPEYFARYKMRDFQRLVTRRGAPLNGRFLDFGSGIGASVKPFSEFLPGAHLTCADVSAESLAESRLAHGDRCEYIPLSEGPMELPDESLDGAFACCVFHHIPHSQHISALTDIHRVLKPGAPLMIYEHNPLNPLTVRAVNTCPLDENAVLIRGREMARRCKLAGFSAAKVDYRVFFPAALSALRSTEDALRWLPLGAQYMIHATR